MQTRKASMIRMSAGEQAFKYRSSTSPMKSRRNLSVVPSR